jgi:hypothetical protein
MALFNKTDMVYKDYDWKAKYEHDDPKVTGKPDNTLFARHEGYEMLYLVNAFAEIHSWKRVESCQHVERLLREKLPSDIRSQIKVKEWLEANLNK